MPDNRTVCFGLIFLHSEAPSKNKKKKPITTGRERRAAGPWAFSVGVGPQEQEGGSDTLSVSKNTETEEIWEAFAALHSF